MARPILLIPSTPKFVDVHVQIPAKEDNLFERLIRDPQAKDRPMREGQCTEMLRTVLVACPSLRTVVLRWLAELTGTPGELIDELAWSLETEQSIGSKRDDLRIEGRDSNDSRRIVLWTIEVKVAAPIHDSSIQGWASDADNDVDGEIVSQLVNYDTWLAMQDVPHKAGYVLSLNDMSSDLPEALRETWHCFTWTRLALEVSETLATNQLPESERPLAEHMTGFIRQRLWDTTDMTISRIELDDVALLRALAAIGPSCSRKIKDLVGQFTNVFESSDLPFVTIGPTTSFFDRSDVAQYAIVAKCVSNNSWLSVNAGVVADDVSVWISCYSSARDSNARETREAVGTILRQKENDLLERNEAWSVADNAETGNVRAKITMSLISVLPARTGRLLALSLSETPLGT